MSLHGFGQALARARRDQGFQTAYGFFKSSGGPKVLGMTLVNYASIEQGRSLPKVSRLVHVLRALNLPAGSAQRKELVRSYLESLLGGDELLKELGAGSAPASPSDGEPVTLGEQAARQAVRQRSFHMSPAQLKLLAVDPSAYACHMYLVNTPGFTVIEEIARACRLPLPKADAALKALGREKLVELSKGRARSRLSYKVVKLPPTTPATSGIIAGWHKHRKGLLETSKVIRDLCMTSRLTTRDMERYLPYIRHAMDLLNVYGDVEKTPDSRVYAVEVKVSEIFE